MWYVCGCGGEVKSTLLHTVIQSVGPPEAPHVEAAPYRAQGSKSAPKGRKITEGHLAGARYPLA